MLKTRVITGLILALVALIAIYLLPLWAYALFFWMVGGLGAYEYAGLAGIEKQANERLQEVIKEGRLQKARIISQAEEEAESLGL